MVLFLLGLLFLRLQFSEGTATLLRRRRECRHHQIRETLQQAQTILVWEVEDEIRNPELLKPFHLVSYFTSCPNEGPSGSHPFNKRLRRFLRLPILPVVSVEGFAELVLVTADQTGAVVGSLDRIQLPASILAKQSENLQLTCVLVSAQTDSIPSVREIGNNPQERLLPYSTDPDLRRHRSRVTPGSIDLEVFALERCLVLGPHRSYDLDCFPQLLHPFPNRWEGDTIRLVLWLVPTGANRQLQPSSANMVKGCAHLSQQ